MRIDETSNLFLNTGRNFVSSFIVKEFSESFWAVKIELNRVWQKTKQYLSAFLFIFSKNIDGIAWRVGCKIIGRFFGKMMLRKFEYYCCVLMLLPKLLQLTKQYENFKSSWLNSQDFLKFLSVVGLSVFFTNYCLNPSTVWNIS